MNLTDTLITCICQTSYSLFEMHFAFLEETEIMSSTFVECSTKYLAARLVGNNLGLLSMTFLLTRITQLLFFLGRSIGLSVTSINTTSNCVSSRDRDFLPGKRKRGSFIRIPSVSFIISQTRLSEIP